MIRLAEQETTRSSLLVKASQLERVLHLFHIDGLSTLAIAARLGIDEKVVCDRLNEADRGR